MHAPPPERESFDLRLGAKGRLILPAAFRRKHGLKEGDHLFLVSEPDGAMRLRTRRQIIEEAVGMWANVAPGRSATDELIAERRREARREEEGR